MHSASLSDSALLTQWLNRRSEEAFRELVGRYAGLVHGTARRTCGDDVMAAELAQLTFIALARKAKSLTGCPSLAGWLHQTAILLARNQLRQATRENRKRLALKAAMEPPSPAPDDAWQDLQPVLDDALAALSAKDREALLLRFYRSLSVKEIAATLGIATAAAQKRVDRATDRLRGKLLRRGCQTGGSLSAVMLAGFASDAQAAAVAVPLFTAKAVAAGAAGSGVISTTTAFLTATAMKTTSAVVLLVGLLTVGIWQFQDSRGGAGAPDAGTAPRMSQAALDAKIQQAELEARHRELANAGPRDRYSDADWDRLMERLIAAEDTPFEDKERAFNELSHMARLHRAQWFFEEFARHKSIDECIAFCEALPFDSESHRAVTQKLVAKILKEYDFAAAVEHIRKMAMGPAYATLRIVERELPDSFRLADVLALKRRLPEDWHRAMLSEAVTRPKSALGYIDMQILFRDQTEKEPLTRAVLQLACTGKLTCGDLLDVMTNPAIADAGKQGILQNGGHQSKPPDLATFKKMFGGEFPPALVDTYVRAIAPAIEQADPGNAAAYGQAIPDKDLREYFFFRVANRWSSEHGTAAGNPYLDEISPSQRGMVDELLRLRTNQAK
jgi:RNA polymerase sigma factor (sigma-70 family)